MRALLCSLRTAVRSCLLGRTFVFPEMGCLGLIHAGVVRRTNGRNGAGGAPRTVARKNRQRAAVATDAASKPTPTRG